MQNPTEAEVPSVHDIDPVRHHQVADRIVGTRGSALRCLVVCRVEPSDHHRMVLIFPTL